MDLPRSHRVNLMGHNLKFLKINGVCATPFREQDDLKKRMPVRKIQVLVCAHKIADARDQKLGEALVAPQQVTNAICWYFFQNENRVGKEIKKKHRKATDLPSLCGAIRIIQTNVLKRCRAGFYSNTAMAAHTA